MRLRKQIAGFNSTLNFEPGLVTKSSSTGQTSDQYWCTPPSSTGQLSDQYWFIPPLPFRAPIFPSMRGSSMGAIESLDENTPLKFSAHTTLYPINT